MDGFWRFGNIKLLKKRFASWEATINGLILDESRRKIDAIVILLFAAHNIFLYNRECQKAIFESIETARLPKKAARQREGHFS